MKSQVFGCPSCQQPFQVLADQAGQIVQCPGCAQSVEIPATAFSHHETLPESQATVPSQMVSTCDQCHGQFGVTEEMFGTQVACPHCRQATQIQDPFVEVPVIKIELIDKSNNANAPKAKNEKSETIERRKEAFEPLTAKDTPEKPSVADLLPPTNDSVDSKVQKNQASSATTDAQLSDRGESTKEKSHEEERAPVDDLLPPRFEVADPTRIRVGSLPDNKILLPDGEGGLKQVDQRIVQVEHRGQKVSLVALTPKQRIRRRIITNMIAILIGIAILWMAFMWLT